MNIQINTSNNSNQQSPEEMRNSMSSNRSIQKNSNIQVSHLLKTLKNTSREHFQLKSLLFQLYDVCTKYDDQLQKDPTQTKAIQNLLLCKILLQQVNDLIKDVIYDIEIDQNCNRKPRFMKVKGWFNTQISKLQFINNTIQQNPQQQIYNWVGSLILFRGLLIQSTCQTKKIKVSQIISESQKKQQASQIQSVNHYLQKTKSYSKLQTYKP